MRRRGWARKVERYCCVAVTYFPLVFVYGLTSWAVWVEAGIGFVPSKNAWTGASSPSLISIPYAPFAADPSATVAYQALTIKPSCKPELGPATAHT